MKAWSPLRALAGAGWAMLTGCTVYVHEPPPFRAPVLVAEPPRLVLIAGTGIRYCPELDDDVFFCEDRWFAWRVGVWYVAPVYSGPWVVVERGRLPAAFLEVPPERFKHRPERFHPAHEHHPDLDDWNREGTPESPGRWARQRHRGWGEGEGRGRGRD